MDKFYQSTANYEGAQYSKISLEGLVSEKIQISMGKDSKRPRVSIFGLFLLKVSEVADESHLYICMCERDI